MSTVIIRADSSSTMGTGHIMRDMVLANRDFADDRVIFATQNLPGNINHKIDEAGYEKILLESGDIDEFNETIRALNPETVVIDHYGIDYRDEKRIKEATGATLFVLDDTYERHHCDVLLNHNVSADEKKYKDLVPKGCEIKGGSKYTLIRNEFIKEKEKKRKLKTEKLPYRIFVGMGGSDPQGYNLKIIDQLKDNNYNLVIVTTSANHKIEELQNRIKGLSNIELYIDYHNIASLMNNCDMAIVTPSVMINEIVFMRIPFVAIKVIENQNDMYQFLKERGFYTLLNSNIYKLNEYIRVVMEEYEKQLKLIDDIAKGD